MPRLTWLASPALVALLAILMALQTAPAQQLARRLILTDGSYQLAVQWEVKGDRVRYLSAERNEWEELPYSLVDWPATEKFAADRAAGKPDPEAAELDKELEAERRAEEARNPLIAPGLHLPDDASVLLLDTFENQPELIELQQDTGQLDRNTRSNVLRATVNPIATARQDIELDGLHARVQAHAAMPVVYVQANSPEAAQQPQQPELPWDRFHIVRAELKKDKRIVGTVKISPLRKVSQQQDLIATTSERLTGGWVKVTPTAALPPGEYALVELLGEEGMNTYVWDFGVNPSAPANAGALKPEPVPAAAKDPKDIRAPQ